LRTLAHSLSSGLRRIDVIGRYGGEEFGVILLDASPEAAFHAVDKIRQRFSEIMFDAKGNVFSATFSAGVSGSRGHPTTEQLIAAADAQMYLAKRTGRNRTLGERLL
jgi:diguanylate cyclase (GGDEF)-like protein